MQVTTHKGLSGELKVGPEPGGNRLVLWFTCKEEKAGQAFLDNEREENVRDVAVLPHWRRQGIATALMKRMVDEARARGVTKLVVATNPDNEAAIGLYTKLSFVQTGEFNHLEIGRAVRLEMELWPPL